MSVVLASPESIQPSSCTVAYFPISELPLLTHQGTVWIRLTSGLLLEIWEQRAFCSLRQPAIKTKQKTTQTNLELLGRRKGRLLGYKPAKWRGCKPCRGRPLAFCEPWIPPGLKLTLHTVVTRSARPPFMCSSWAELSVTCNWKIPD